MSKVHELYGIHTKVGTFLETCQVDVLPQKECVMPRVYNPSVSLWPTPQTAGEEKGRVGCPLRNS